MVKHLDAQVIDILQGENAEHRKLICGEELVYFAVYYFPEFFTYDIPEFHFELYDALERLTKGEYSELIEVMFRESAKTSIAKIFITWCICYRKKRYINYDSYDKSNSESALFDIAVWLQTNEKIIRDFGQLYYEDSDNRFSKLKRVSNFITGNGVKIEAFSTQESTRGRVYKNIRPDLFVLDDFETTKTKDSHPRTKSVIDHIDEMNGGLGVNGSIVYLCNYITESGSVAYLLDRAKDNPRIRTLNVPVIKNSKIMWPDKYVWSDSEAAQVNGNLPPNKHKISLEQKARSLKSTFESDMMNNPSTAEDKVFDRNKIEEMLRNARAPSKNVGGFKIWEPYDPSHRYALGADTAKGVGRDSNATAIIDFSTLPNRVIGTYKNNLIAPNNFAYEIQKQGQAFGECLVAPEVNNTGYATITELIRIYPLDKIYTHASAQHKIHPSRPTEYGWETNGATKPEMIYQLKKAVEDGLLVIYDEDLLNELKYYAQLDLETMTVKEGMTRHYDLMTACAIAWAMRNHAVAATKRTVKIKDQATPRFPQINI